jgi:invasion protein IalB
VRLSCRDVTAASGVVSDRSDLDGAKIAWKNAHARQNAASAAPDLHPLDDRLRTSLRLRRVRFDADAALPAREQSMIDVNGLRHTAIGIALLSTLSLLFFNALPAPASAQGVVKSKHGDWEIRCETPPGAQHEQCALLQSVAAEDRPNINLVVIVLKTADGKSKLLRVIAPLGVLLPSGLGLKIDNADVGRAGFVRCLPTGCVAEVVMDDKLIGQLRNGHNATFIIFQTPEEGIGIPLALNGFGEGFDALP